MLFLNAFSWETDLWVMLSDFKVKKKNEIGRGNLCLTENRVSRNEMWYAAGNVQMDF